MPQNYLDQVQEINQSVNPLFAFLGVEVVEISMDRAVLRLPIKPELIQGGGVAAGGILATLLDEAMAHAVLSGNDKGKFATTVNMNVNYFRPVYKHADLICEARVTKRGKRVVFVEAIATNNGHEAACATASFLVV